jgi:IclR family transcriptional regulator, acetate operon repressor
MARRPAAAKQIDDSEETGSAQLIPLDRADGDSRQNIAPGAQRTLDIFAAFAHEQRPLSISELARLLKIPGSTCHGLVKSLEQLGYVTEIHRLKGYYPTRLLLQHATHIARYDPIPALVQPILADLRDHGGETIVFGKRARQQAVYLDVLTSPAGLRHIVSPGDTRPLYACAIGKALLSAFPPEERARMLSKFDFKPITPNTRLDSKQLAQDIEKGIARGWFVSDGEYTDGVMALAVPVHVDGDVYGIVMTGPQARMRKNLSSQVDLMLAAKRKIESTD